MNNLSSLKILHLIDSGGLYGAEVVLLHLVEEQLKAGLNPFILSAGTYDITEKPIEKAARDRGLPLITWRMDAGLNIYQAWKILCYARKNNFILLHSHGYKFNILMGLFPRSLRAIPILSTLHGYVNAPRYSKMWVYEFLDKLFLPRIDATVLVNSRMRDLKIIQGLNLSNVYEIPNGIPANNNYVDITNDLDVQKFLSTHPRIIGAVGRLSPEKGLCYLIEAFSKLHSIFPGLGLLIIGEGNERKKLQKQVQEHDISQHVLMPGYRASIPSYLSKFDIYIMPSLTEGLPITLLEAMLESIPIIASNVGGIPQVLDHGRYGKLVSPKRADQLFEAIEYMLNNSIQAKKIAIEGHQWVMNHYSVSSMEYAYRKLYFKLSSI